jgi:hypothetical protein
MTSYKQCTALTNNGKGPQCTRAAVINGLCTQHYNMSLKQTQTVPIEYKSTTSYEQALPPELMKFGISEYIPYDEVKELSKDISNLHIDPNRVKIKEYTQKN